MADSTSVVASSPVSGEDLERAERFASEPFILNGEDAESALTPGTRHRAALDSALEDPGAARRFWFEHATGAGKTVAALGFVEGSRTGGILILTHRRNLVDQFLGELRDRGYRKRISGALLGRNGDAPANGPVT